MWPCVYLRDQQPIRIVAFAGDLIWHKALTSPRGAATPTQVSWRIPDSRWGFRGTLPFAECGVWRSEYCPGRICRHVCTRTQQSKNKFLVVYRLFHLCCQNSQRYWPSVWERALGAVLLHVHAKEAHVHAINLLKSKKCFGSIGESLGHLASVHKPERKKKSTTVALFGQEVQT